MLVGTLFGYSLSRIGFSDWSAVHAMFRFADMRLFFTFVVAVLLSSLAFFVFRKQLPLATNGMHKGLVIGSVLFGVGWAITGACPSIALVQLGEGKWPAVWTCTGIVIGVWLQAKVQARYLKWPSDSC